MNLLVVSKEAWGDTRWARKQWLPYFLAQQEVINKVVYVDRPSAWWRGQSAHQDETANNINVVQKSLVFPLEKLPFVRGINRKIIARKLLSIYTTDLPWVSMYYHPYDVDMMGILAEKSHIVFDWTEDWADFHDDEYMVELQGRCVKEANIVFTVTQTLYQRAVDLRGSDESVFYVPNATVFTPSEPSLDEPQLLRSISKPRLGFIGHIGPWFDEGLVESIARNQPTWQWVLAGGVSEQAKARLSEYDNIHLLGVFSPKALPALMQHCDVLVAPYKQGIQGDATKLYDYLAMKKPIVSTACETSGKLQPWVRECYNTEDWLGSISEALEMKTLPLASDQDILQHHWQARSSYVAELFQSMFHV